MNAPSTRYRLACSFALAFCFIAHPQTPAAAQTPDQFMRQAADTMSLTAPGMKPWHLRARFKYFAPDGSVQREMLMEEWWASPEHSKTTYSWPGFTRTEYRVGDKIFFVGSDKVSVIVTSMVLHPLPLPSGLDSVTYQAKEIEVGKGKLKCYLETPKHPGDKSTASAVVASYCFDEPGQLLRLVEYSFGSRMVLDQIVAINGHYVAKQITLANSQGKPSQTITVEQLDPQLGVDEAALSPPPDASPLRRRVSVSSRVMQGNRISGDEPRYPLNTSVRGTVVLQATVNEQGTIEDLKAVSGPPALQQAALEAVRGWRYKPYLFDGDPVQVQTTINVVFH